MHGLALNVNSRLEHFEWIVPCGIQDKGVTSISAELGREVSVDTALELLAAHFAAQYDAEVEWQDAMPGGVSL
jgi:lipoyl(octanoyl) transferase